MSSNENTTDNVDKLEQEDDKCVATLADAQQNRFNVVLDEDAGDTGVRADSFALLGNRVLVGHNGAATNGVHGWYNRQVVLESVEVIICQVHCLVERVDERWVKGAK